MLNNLSNNFSELRKEKNNINFKKTTKKPNYRLTPLLITGFLIFFLITAILSGLWSLFIFLSRLEIGSSFIIPSIIFFLAVFLSSIMISYIIGARSFKPNFILILLLNLLALAFSGFAFSLIPGFILKLICSLFVGFLCHVFLKNAFKNKRNKKALRNIA